MNQVKLKYFSRPNRCNQMHKHASKKEADRCDELNSLLVIGKIKFLKQQPIFTLQRKFKVGKETIREIKYRADFSYFDVETRTFIVEDVKGFKTKDYIIKKKMLICLMKDRKDFLFKET